jgi:transposase
MPVIWRKVSLGTDSVAGSRFVERMLTAVTTLRLQKRNVLDYMTAACDAAFRGLKTPSLLPATTLPFAAAA